MDVEREAERQRASYVEDAKVGSSRRDIEQLLRGRNVFFTSAWARTSDFVKVGREPSPYYYCSWQDVYVEFEFEGVFETTAQGSSAALRPTQITERLKAIKLFRKLEDCL